MLFSLAHKLVIGFSVVSVIMGVFIQETFKVATTNDEIMLLEKERQMRNHLTKMNSLFEHADENMDNVLDLKEFEMVLSDPGITKWLTAEELVKGGARLKGAARSIDVITLLAEHRDLQDTVNQIA